MEQLKEYRAKHGHLKVPHSHSTLGTFAKDQRRCYKFLLRGKPACGMTHEKERQTNHCAPNETRRSRRETLQGSWAECGPWFPPPSPPATTTRCRRTPDSTPPMVCVCLHTGSMARTTPYTIITIGWVTRARSIRTFVS